MTDPRRIEAREARPCDLASGLYWPDNLSSGFVASSTCQIIPPHSKGLDVLECGCWFIHRDRYEQHMNDHLTGTLNLTEPA